MNFLVKLLYLKQTVQSNVSSSGVTNFDILKRLSNLEKHVLIQKLEEDMVLFLHSRFAEDDDDFYKTRVITTSTWQWLLI